MFKKLRELDARGRNIFEIVMVILLSLGFLIYVLWSNFLKARAIQEESMRTVIVQDGSRYFTVLGCAKKYVETVVSKDKENILTLLTEDYKEKNRITEANVYNYIPNLDASALYDYEGEEMYQHRLSKNVVEYYLKGKIKKLLMDEATVTVDYDMTVTLYENEFLFSIRPGIGDRYNEK
ncbi:MAG TPA: hypothetical protein DCY94_01565 [Firmicutes bacterium]|nr:hypothetical protein [Bacillota bacterium]